MGNCCPNHDLKKSFISSISEDKSKLVTTSATKQPVLVVIPPLTLKQQISKDDFIKVRMLGQGAFGKVYQVRKKNTNKIYAMKQIEIKKIRECNLETNTVLERNVLKQSKHPFIVKLKFAFQNPKYIFFVMECINGGQFYNVLKCKKNGLPENVVRFVAAEVVLALEYLNTKLKVIYRDLKPENILLTETGHVKLTDFGLATLRKDNEKSYLLAGTPEYLAPEIITRQGHSYEVDIWTLGILIFEMINGNPPFNDPKRRVEMITKQILLNDPTYPKTMSQSARDLIQKLLRNDPKERLGVKGGYEEIKNHPFFNSVSWDVIHMQISPLRTFAEKSNLKNSTKVVNHSPQTLEDTLNNLQMTNNKVDGITYLGEGETFNSKI
ncbi:unnamed protein product [Paramecium octaurelia]|uniref:non-specific serine/threonine protein kinase n=1 Tax=Paramecium octaurelia TaxID=43137 RepID=A0A8S1XJS9_PAROT|nr:unnamed protein product [Paramecium octaurelia]